MSYRNWLCAMMLSACGNEHSWTGYCHMGDEHPFFDLAVVDQDDLSSSFFNLGWSYADSFDGDGTYEEAVELSGAMDARSLTLWATLEGGGMVRIEAARDGENYRGVCYVETDDRILGGLLLLRPPRHPFEDIDFTAWGS